MDSIDLASAKEMIGPGWAGLLEVLYRAMPTDVVVTTVKEKFGGLRVYYDGGTEPFDRLNEHLESASTHVCEQCGRVGQLRTIHGWISTLCEAHHRERVYLAELPAAVSTPGQATPSLSDEGVL